MAQVQAAPSKAQRQAALGAKLAATPKGKAEAAAVKAGSVAIIQLKKGALSLEVGPAVIAALDQTDKMARQMADLDRDIRAKRYDQLAVTTNAVMKAAKADDSIDLSVLFAGDPKKVNHLYDQLGIALGFREIVNVPDPKNSGVVYDKIVTAKAIGNYFPMPGENKETDEYKRKNNLRSTFLALLKKCGMAAAGMIEKDITSKYDAKKGTLLISGSAVKKHFGMETVALDERKIVGEGDKAIELHEKPSFTAIAAMGAEAHGASIHRGSNTRGTLGAAINKPEVKAAVAAASGMKADQAIISICGSLVKAIENYAGSLTGPLKAALESVNSAIDVKLVNG